MMQTGYAVQAYPGIIKATQADGTEISIRLHGDERGHYTTTADGYPLIFNEQTGNYEYASVVNNAIVSSGLAAADAPSRSAEAVAFLRGVDSEAFVKLCAEQRHQKAQTMNAARARRTQNHTTGLINNFPHMGVQHSPVILVEFSDKSFTTMSDPKQYYTDALNKEGFTASNGANGSARDFFVASSDGKFQPTFDVYGPVKINYSQRAFGEGDNDYEPNLATIIREAVKQLDDSVDFKQYDHDGDGYIDNIYIFYAGTGAADSNDRNVIWPHSYYVKNGFGVTVRTNDGVEVDSYTCSNEVNGSARAYPAGIGTFVHEFGHCLGLADHYDTDYNYTNYNPGYWDTMCSGSYTNNGNTPPLYSAFEKYSLGWINLTELTNTADTTCVLPYLGDSNKAYVVGVPGKDNEYYIFENRQKKGWDKYLPAAGMLVWHIDYNEYDWYMNQPNNVGSHQRIDIVEANGIPSGYSYGRNGVPFPGSDNVTTCAFRSWAGDTLTVLDKITHNDSIVTFIIQGSDKNLVAPKLLADSIGFAGMRCTWEPVQNAEYYRLSVSRVDDSDTLTVLDEYNDIRITDTLCVLRNLAEQTEYEITLKAGADIFLTAADTIRATTTIRPFSEYQVMNLVATDTTQTAFTAKWDALDEAQTYAVTLLLRQYDDSLKTTYKDSLLDAYDGKDVGNTTSCQFTGLSPQTDYILTVSGVKNGEKSLPSDSLKVTTLPTATAIRNIEEAALAGEKLYDLSGRQLTEAPSQGGIYIIRRDGKTFKQAR